MENSGKSRENKIVKVSIIGIITNILLVIVKAIIGVIAKSTAVILLFVYVVRKSMPNILNLFSELLCTLYLFACFVRLFLFACFSKTSVTQVLSGFNTS